MSSTGIYPVDKGMTINTVAKITNKDNIFRLNNIDNAINA